MKPQEAISILMLSPCYWLMKVPQRRALIKEFLATYATITMTSACPSSKKK
jgi:hypothetical protein